MCLQDTKQSTCKAGGDYQKSKHALAESEDFTERLTSLKVKNSNENLPENNALLQKTEH